MTDPSLASVPAAPTMSTRPSGAPAAVWLDGLLAGAAGAIVLALGLEVGDRLAGRAGFGPAVLGSAMLHGPVAAAGEVTTGAREVAVGYALVLLVALPIGMTVWWWTHRLPRFPSSGSAWLAAALCLGVGLLALDRVAGSHLIQWLGPWRTLGAIAPAATVLPLVLWKRQPRLVQNRRDLRDDEP